ncbi:hypothetical protein H5410_056743 [Solanum commersonii]|uniref:Uncharacterized protein n=1 Tax=Solanum commersonii TaxID=4109 RepID=A0A9J5WL26_SOLCO|nr:hypothetical protein H5410_056743 [Solanum commersonii]
MKRRGSGPSVRRVVLGIFLEVLMKSCRRAKIKVMNNHMDDFVEEFSRLYDYVEDFNSTNPGTIVVVKTSKNTIPGIDGVCKGELLTSISNDGNNQMYLVTWTIVNKESKDRWSWLGVSNLTWS